MAGLIFEPHPPNFGNQYNFWRCSNEVQMIFWFLYWYQIFKDQCGSVPSISVAVLGLWLVKIEIKYQLNNPSIPRSSVGALIGRYRLKNDRITTRFEVLTNDVSSSLDVVLCIIVRASVNKVVEAKSVIKDISSRILITV